MRLAPTRSWWLGLSLAALACANEPPTTNVDGEHAKTQVVITVDRTDPVSADAEGSASAVARFVSVPAFSDATRALSAAGATLYLPAVDTCRESDAQDEIEPAAAPSQGAVEFVEAGDVSIAAAGMLTPLVPHAFPTVGGIASGVLYTTRDRASSALPSAVPYVVSATGSESVPMLRAVGDAPRAPSGVQLGGAALKDVTEVHTGRPMDLAWAPGDGNDVVYAELLAYDGSPSIVCTFHDDAGTGTVPAEAFAGVGTGRISVHRVRSRRFDSGAAPSGEMRFDFQVDAPVEFTK
jgi:hypothetical protein